MRAYTLTWLLITLWLSREYWVLAHPGSGWSSLRLVLGEALSFGPRRVTEAGAPLSYGLGWLGLGTMGLMNLYSLRKRLLPGKGCASLAAWLNFHIFCGLTGPVLICFHADFHARGLVAISFWSMIVSLVSGVVGRYLYRQLSYHRSEPASARRLAKAAQVRTLIGYWHAFHLPFAAFMYAAAAVHIVTALVLRVAP